MLALEARDHPSMLRGDATMMDEQGGTISGRQLAETLDEWYELILFLDDWHSMRLVILKADYDKLPAILMECRKVYDLHLQRSRQEAERRQLDEIARMGR